MKFNINIENSSISFLNQEIELNSYGIHILNGKNGVGKTTIAEHIVFSNKYKSKCSYICQETPYVNKTIKQFLTRYNKHLNSKLMFRLLNKFNLSNIELNMKVSMLSGGELTKLNIISGLIKNSDIYLLDEPTNNLDDQSVITLCEILEELSRTKSVVIITHDKRINFTNFKLIKVVSKQVICDYSIDCLNEDIEGKEKINTHSKYPFFNVIRERIFNKLSIISIFVFMLLMIELVFVNEMVLDNLLYSFELPENNGYVYIYSVDQIFEENNHIYAEYNNLKINEDDYYKTISYDNLNSLNENRLVDEIYYYDEMYIEELYEKQVEGTLLDEISILSIPYDLQLNSYNFSHLIFDVNKLIEGRLPYDGENEIVLSNKLINLFYNDLNIEDCIGQEIMFKGENYHIVGIGYNDIAIISYKQENAYGVRHYNSKTSDSNIEDIIEYAESAELSNPTKPFTLVLKTDISDEEELLNYLVSTYPANNYQSYYNAYSIKNLVNERLLTIIYVANAIFALFIGFIFLQFNKKEYTLAKFTFDYYDNYYLTYNRTKRIYILKKIFETLFLTVIIIFLVSYISNVKELYNIIIINLIVIEFPLFLCLLKKLFKTKMFSN